MARFDRQIQTALKLIKKNGQIVTWRQTEKANNDSQPWKQQNTAPIDNEVIICFLPFDKDAKEFLHYIKDTEVATGSIIGLMGAVNFEPSIEDIVIRDGVTLKINDIELLAPNGQKILYTVEFIG